jgi:hypothetical protein
MEHIANGPTKLLSLHYDPPLLFIGTCILFMWGKKANYVTSSIFLYSLTYICLSYVYAKSIYIFLTWDDPKFKLKYIVKWTKLQDDKIRIMSENS